jgi:Tol biopolymer transport system component
MAEAKQNGKWDIYLWPLGSSDKPANLTSGDDCRDEDPKFSPDGNSICFKQTPPGGNGNLKIMDLTGHVTNPVTNNIVESGMPYYSTDAKSLLYARGAGNTSDIYMINVNGSGQQALESESGLQEYYPIVRDSSSFLFARWYSQSNNNDQVYMGYFSGAPATRLKFNEQNSNDSDPFPCGANYIFMSSTRSGTRGGYDLYVADLSTGNTWSLSYYHSSINSEDNELGACYSLF